MEIADLLIFAVERHASDLHISAHMPPMIRLNGDIRKLGVPPLSAKEVQDMVYDIMNDRQRKVFENEFEVDFSFEINNLGRFRVNVFQQSKGIAGVFRVIPTNVRTLDDVGIPETFKLLLQEPRGIILVTGPTGSGKSTTLAAMLNEINENLQGHIITLEDPIEFIHQNKKCIIHQRELGEHTLSFSAALRASLREDPDVILVGEMRDLETIRLALTAAETGHLVLSTVHTSSAPKTIDRIVDVFPAGEKELVRTMLAESLRAIVAQVLVKTADGQGRAAALEIMLGTPAIRNLIRENKIAQLYSMMQAGQALGMKTLDQALGELVKQNKINAAEAKMHAVQKSAFSV